MTLTTTALKQAPPGASRFSASTCGRAELISPDPTGPARGHANGPRCSSPTAGPVPLAPHLPLGSCPVIRTRRRLTSVYRAPLVLSEADKYTSDGRKVAAAILCLAEAVYALSESVDAGSRLVARAVQRCEQDRLGE